MVRPACRGEGPVFCGVKTAVVCVRPLQVQWQSHDCCVRLKNRTGKARPVPAASPKNEKVGASGREQAAKLHHQNLHSASGGRGSGRRQRLVLLVSMMFLATALQHLRWGGQWASYSGSRPQKKDMYSVAFCGGRWYMGLVVHPQSKLEQNLVESLYHGWDQSRAGSRETYCVCCGLAG